MKDAFLNYSVNLLTNEYNYEGDLLDRVKYGLEIIYISVTKIFVILLLSIILGYFKETLLFTIFITPIKSVSYGIHAKKSWHCYVFSILLFMLLPSIFVNLNFTLIHKIFISIFSFISMIIYAPADTHKRPLVNKNHRNKLKLYSLLITSIYIVIIFVIKDNYIINLLIDALITQSLLINPLVYRLLNMPYNNYKAYQNGSC